MLEMLTFGLFGTLAWLESSLEGARLEVGSTRLSAGVTSGFPLHCSPSLKPCLAAAGPVDISTQFGISSTTGLPLSQPVPSLTAVGEIRFPSQCPFSVLQWARGESDSFASGVPLSGIPNRLGMPSYWWAS